MSQSPINPDMVPERLDLRSMSVTDDQIAKLREAFPEAFREGNVDFDTLKRSLSEWVEPGKERFGLNWPGKADCMRVIQAPSVGTLLPMRDDSVNFDATQNLIIEGDNLEVLKLLQKSYYGQVKLVYIDPPYNTGGEFIYPDNFREGLQGYLRYSGQIDAQGLKLSTNTESDGRYHSKWLNMMYPRLFLARNLMCDEGVIFVSIDDHEVHDLRAIMNEVFGEENFLATLIWNKGHSQQQGVFKQYHDYVVVYARSRTSVSAFASLESGDVVGGALKKISRGNPRSEFTFPAGLRCDAPDGTDFNGTWGDAETVELVRGTFKVRGGKTTEQMTLAAGWTQLNQMKALFYGTGEPVIDTRGQVVEEFFFNSSGKLKYRKKRAVETPPTVQNWGTQSKASEEVAELFEGKQLFDRPKPIQMLADIIGWVCSESNDIVLDFFAGSGTTAHAAMKLCAGDGVRRPVLLVQLPEPLAPNSLEQGAAAAFCDSLNRPRAITEITKERVRRAAKLISKEREGMLRDSDSETPDLGYRAYKLATSNFKPWDGVSSEITSVESTLYQFAENVVDGRHAEDILTEILLKSGFEPTTLVQRLTLATKEVISVADGAMLVCLDRELTLEVIEAMVERKPAQIICLDAGFQKNDQLKVNAVQTIKSRARSEESTIVFKVV